jgi:hypothetical protein
MLGLGSLVFTEAQQVHNMTNNPKVAGRINRRNIMETKETKSMLKGR